MMMLSLCLKVEEICLRFHLENLVEQGIIPPGAVLTDKKEKYKATVSIDGSLKIKGISGSIHQVGAKLQGLT